MAYIPNALRLIATLPAPDGGDGTPLNRYAYSSNATAAAIETDGFFDGALNNGLNKGDIIEAVVDHDGTIGMNIYLVTAGGADVAIQDVFAQHA